MTANPLRTEHDALAQRLEVRPSVDVARSGFVLAFLGLMTMGLSWALLWERYARNPSDLGRAHPGLVLAGSLVAAVLGAILAIRGVHVLRRSRRMARDEAALFARLRELRRALELDG